MDSLTISLHNPISAVNGGLARSRGFGIHPDRVWDSHELIFVREGTLHIAEEDQQFSVGQNETLLLWQGRRHRGLAEYSPELSFFWVHFHLSDEGMTGSTILTIPQHVSIRRPDQLTALFRRFLDDQESVGITGVTGGLLIALMLAEVQHSTALDDAVNPASVLLVSQADALIQTHMHESLSTSYLAEQLSCNPDYLGRIFKQVHNETITEAIHRQRILHSCKLLMTTNLPISAIALRCGFQDMSYFRRVFRRRQGMNPRAFRQMYAHLAVNTE